jgi:hypothetical protein
MERVRKRVEGELARHDEEQTKLVEHGQNETVRSNKWGTSDARRAVHIEWLDRCRMSAPQSNRTRRAGYAV